MRYMNKHLEWLQSITNESGRAIAQRADLSPATLNRQIKREEFTAESVIAIARAYGHSPVQALAKTGFITATEASGLTKSEIVELLDDRDLISLLASRIKVGEPTWDQPLDKAIDNNVTELRSNTGDDGVRGADYDDDTVHEWDDSMEHAADSSLDEQQERENRGEDPID